MGYIGKENDGLINQDLHPAGRALRPAYREGRKSAQAQIVWLTARCWLMNPCKTTRNIRAAWLTSS
ncbi:hypothetical protein ACE10Z_01695 [Bradyrhizobium sp. Pha-3]|uniref:hypothetical protein n=1 Tax=Bradyrhizobium sp. Pha-3 TaxID=208375 RepID=UPI0035D4EE5D